jgi:hypothetical protein
VSLHVSEPYTYVNTELINNNTGLHSRLCYGVNLSRTNILTLRRNLLTLLQNRPPLSLFYTECGRGTFLPNIDKFLQVYTVLHPRIWR